MLAGCEQLQLQNLHHGKARWFPFSVHIWEQWEEEASARTSSLFSRERIFQLEGFYDVISLIVHLWSSWRKKHQQVHQASRSWQSPGRESSSIIDCCEERERLIDRFKSNLGQLYKVIFFQLCSIRGRNISKIIKYGNYWEQDLQVLIVKYNLL